VATDARALETANVLISENGVRQLAKAMDNNPFARVAEDALNSNPLHQVIPVNWAEVVRALRTVWLYQFSRPENAAAKLLDFNLRSWQSTLGIWNDAALRYLGLEPSTGMSRSLLK
jgi:polyhydroxyalkanoate synthase subunit PhaC